MMYLKIAVACALVILMPGCSHRVYVTSNSYADSEIIPYGFPIGASFSIAPTKSPAHNAMLSKEISRKIAAILMANDYMVVDDGPADYYLSFSYGMESSIQTRNITTYVPGASQLTTGYVHSTHGGAVYQEQTATPGTFVTIPEEYTVYERTLNIHVHTTNPFTKNKDTEEVWQASAVSAGETGDLRETMDYLLASAFKHFGENTGGRIVQVHKA